MIKVANSDGINSATININNNNYARGFEETLDFIHS